MPPVPVDPGIQGWRQASQVLMSDAHEGAQAGISVAIDGNYAVVGALGRIQDGVNMGGAYVFRRDGNDWVEEAILTPSDGRAGDKFGLTVAISGSTVAVGAPNHNAGKQESGAIYVFERSDGKWTEQTKLKSGIVKWKELFGNDLAISGKTIVAGVARDDVVYLYKQDNDSWSLQQTLRPSNRAESNFGVSVAISSTHLAVGASSADTIATDRGALYLFKPTSAGWVEDTVLLAADGAENDGFGVNAAITNDQLIVSARGVHVDGQRLGAAYVFKLTASGWQQTGRLVRPTTQVSTAYGTSVDIAGDYAVVGAYLENGTVVGSGAAYVFHRGRDGWTLQNRIMAVDEQNRAYFGVEVAISGLQIFVGSSNYFGAGAKSGATHFFNPVLIPQRIGYCSTPVTATAPTAQDDCAGTITATPDKSVTYDGAGRDTVIWAFDDGNGNRTVAFQDIEVYQQSTSLPIRETAEADSPTRHCWTLDDKNSDGGWAIHEDASLAYGGTAAFRLAANPEGTQNDYLISPTFRAFGGISEYQLSYHYRTAPGSSRERLRVLLLESTGRIVKQLAHDLDLPHTYQSNTLRFSVPATGDYTIAFTCTGYPGSMGLLIDNIDITAFQLPTDGASALAGSADDSCITTTGQGVSGEAWTRFLNADGQLLAEVYPNGNVLGDVQLSMTDYATPPTGPFNNRPLLSRYFNITPERGSGPYTNNGGVRVRLYLTTQELAEFNAQRPRPLDWSDLIITHYDGPNTDCDLLNSNGAAAVPEAPYANGSYTATAHYLEFTTTTFSEFGVSDQAVMPVQLREFTARAEGSDNLIEWRAEGEVDFSHYTVERSVDGVNFTALTRVDGSGQSSYGTRDPAPAMLTYYRLKLVDMDGTFTYSDTVSVSRTTASTDPTVFRSLQAYPVPTQDRVTLRFHSVSDQSVQLRLTDALGRVVYADKIAVRAGANEHFVDMRALPVGTYELLLSDERRWQVVRLVRQ